MTKAAGESRNFRFGGHQSFALRTAWLPKAAQAIEAGEDLFTDPLRGVVKLGLGKNMVEALRVWVEAYGIAHRPEGAWDLTPLGKRLLGTGGHDRFLEDEESLWLLHWNISTLREAPFFAWELLINRWSEPYFTTSEAMTEFAREAERTSRALSSVSARQHFDVWLYTYLPGRSGRGEDGIDSPLASLGLVTRAGDRETAQGRREPVYRFDLAAKPAISDALFLYCLQNWWAEKFEFEETVPLSAVAFAHGAPGRVFRMPETEVQARLMRIATRADKPVKILESVNQYMVQRSGRPTHKETLDTLFARLDAQEAVDA